MAKPFNCPKCNKVKSNEGLCYECATGRRSKLELPKSAPVKVTRTQPQPQPTMTEPEPESDIKVLIMLKLYPALLEAGVKFARSPSECKVYITKAEAEKLHANLGKLLATN